ncbi:MAG: large conductance mechanosensitive channel protein MscL [Lachnospira eligens]
MKKFIQEFKEFALKGNVMNLAVGVIIGAAFQSIVTALTSSFINPLIAVVTGGTNGEGVTVGGTFTIRGVVFDYGSFITAVINFLIMAFVLFLLVKAMNKMMSLGKKKKNRLQLQRIVHTALARYLLRQQDVLSVQQN